MTEPRRSQNAPDRMTQRPAVPVSARAAAARAARPEPPQRSVAGAVEPGAVAAIMAAITRLDGDIQALFDLLDVTTKRIDQIESRVDRMPTPGRNPAFANRTTTLDWMRKHPLIRMPANAIADNSGVAQSSVRKALNELVAEGLLETDKRECSSRVYWYKGE